MKGYRLVTGVIAVGIYLVVVGLLILYFNHKNSTKPQRYVKKDDHRIAISIATIPPASKQHIVKKKTLKKHKPKKPKHKVKKSVTKKKIKHKVAKKVVKKRVVKKKVIHKKIVKNIDKNITKKRHKTNPKDLFANIKVKPKKPLITMSDKPIVSKPKSSFIKMSDKKPTATQKINNSLKKQKVQDSGVSDEYLARVQEILEDWPAQSDFAGESVKVWLYIEPSGKFEFEIKSASTNPDFNIALTQYLKQLQLVGFGPHDGMRTYNFEANFVAKE
jgi:protein TonB